MACTETNLRLSLLIFFCCNLFGAAISVRHKSEGAFGRSVVVRMLAVLD